MPKEDLREIVEETRELSRENHRMLIKLERAAMWRKIFTALYWIVIIGGFVGAYYFIQPYVNAVAGGFGSLFGGEEEVAQEGDAPTRGTFLGDLFE